MGPAPEMLVGAEQSLLDPKNIPGPCVISGHQGLRGSLVTWMFHPRPEVVRSSIPWGFHESGKKWTSLKVAPVPLHNLTKLEGKPQRQRQSLSDLVG